MTIKDVMAKWEQLIDFIFHYIGIVVFATAWFIYKLFYPFYKNIHPTACKVIDFTNGKKTYIVSLAGIFALLYAYHHGTVDLGNVVTNLPMLILAITFRHGMARHMVPKIEGGDEEDFESSSSSTPAVVPDDSSSSSSSSSSFCSSSSSSSKHHRRRHH